MKQGVPISIKGSEFTESGYFVIPAIGQSLDNPSLNAESILERRIISFGEGG